MSSFGQFATNAKLLNITHESYGFSADLIETNITNEYHCGKAGFSGVITDFIVLCKDSR